MDTQGTFKMNIKVDKFDNVLLRHWIYTVTIVSKQIRFEFDYDIPYDIMCDKMLKSCQPMIHEARKEYEQEERHYALGKLKHTISILYSTAIVKPSRIYLQNYIT